MLRRTSLLLLAGLFPALLLRVPLPAAALEPGAPTPVDFHLEQTESAGPNGPLLFWGFSLGKNRVSFQPPTKVRVREASGTLRITPVAGSTEATGEMRSADPAEAALLAAPDPDRTAREQELLARLPAGAQQPRATDYEENPFPHDGFKNFALTMAYEFYGATYRRYVVVSRLDADHVICVELTAGPDGFESFRDAVRELLRGFSLVDAQTTRARGLSF